MVAEEVPQKAPVKSIHFISIIILALAASFYMYEFILQVSPAVMTTDLMKDLSIDAAGLGLISAFYYYAYTPMQLPAGLLYDRFGPRVLITVAVAICATGALFFSFANGFMLVAFGRFFMGLGSAFAFIGALVLLTRWFPPQYFAALAGVIQLMSSVGAIAGQAPLAAAVQVYGWRQTIFVIALAGYLLALTIWLIVRDSPTRRQQQHVRQQKKVSEFRRLGTICKAPQTWLVGFYAFCSWAPVLAFSGLWGVAYLAELYGISTTQASLMSSMVWVGIGIGSPLAGIWSEAMKQRRLPLFICAAIGFIGLVLILFVPHLPMVLAYVALLMVGFAASGQSLSFALVRDNNHSENVGTAIGMNNMMVVSGGAIFQPLVGFLLHYFWNGQLHNGTPVYSVADYQLAMVILPLCYLVGMILASKALRETHCKQVSEAAA